MIRCVAPRPRTFVVLIALVLAPAFCLLACRGDMVHAAERASAAADEETRGATNAAAQQPSSAGTTPVLVELFTSEGCSSCPTADTLLARLQRSQPVPNADILALEEHVDYWDSLGWRDRFSSQQFSARQDAYIERLRLSSEYTPQMIVDGTDQFSGNDVVHALRSIAQAASTPKLALSLSQLTVDGNRIAGQVRVPRPAASRRKSAPFPHADVYAALVQSVASNQVLAGDNGGQTLHHVSVVREMQRIGSLAQAASTRLKFSLVAPLDAASADLRVVVFVQRAGQGAVLGATSSPPIALPAPEISAAAAPSPSGQ
jgi:hypothetical protein